MTASQAEVAATTKPGPGPGAGAPAIKLKPAKGRAVGLPSLWSEKPLVLAFCGHLGSAASVEQVLLLRDARDTLDQAGAALACVVSGGWEHAEAFRRDHNVWYPIFCDAGPAHEAFAVAPELPATFVIDTSGAIRFAHRGTDAFDQVSTWDVAEAVCAITGAHVERPELPEPAPAVDANWAGSPLVQAAAPLPLRGAFEFTCPKCGGSSCETNTISAAGGWLSRMFNYEYRKFTAVSCTACGYSELYKGQAGAWANGADILAGR